MIVKIIQMILKIKLLIMEEVVKLHNSQGLIKLRNLQFIKKGNLIIKEAENYVPDLKKRNII